MADREFDPLVLPGTPVFCFSATRALDFFSSAHRTASTTLAELRRARLPPVFLTIASAGDQRLLGSKSVFLKSCQLHPRALLSSSISLVRPSRARDIRRQK